jgi:hypothetical protein
MSVLSNLGAGTFASPAVLVFAGQPRAVWGADVTGDGKLDLAAAGSADDRVTVLCSEGAGTWCSPWTVGVGHTPFALAAGDFNGDGRVDLAVVNRAGGDLSVLWANTPTEIALPAAASGPWVRAWPNPFSESLAVELQLPVAGTHATVSIYDISGRVVARLLDGANASAVRTLSWDGRDPHGRRIAAGVYFLRIETQGRSWTKKLTRIG